MEFPELDGPVWRIPAKRMKAHREHIIPLSSQAVELLRQLPPHEPDDFIFQSSRSRSDALSENTLLYALYRMGYHSRATIHGFRRTASTWANEQLTPGCDPAAPVRRYDRGTGSKWRLPTQTKTTYGQPIMRANI